MINHQLGKELHQRRFKGEPLTEQEMAQLEAWYAQEDEAEAKLLEVTIPEESVIENLRQEVNDALNQLAGLTQNIQAIALENDKIRKENIHLFELLNKKSDSKAA